MIGESVVRKGVESHSARENAVEELGEDGRVMGDG
jgi:hypothetical protein